MLWFSVIRVVKQPVLKKTDPVSLYHYYMSLWAKYKSNVPGENDWSDLRWSVRQKMAGCAVKPTSSKVSAQFHCNILVLCDRKYVHPSYSIPNQ